MDKVDFFSQIEKVLRKGVYCSRKMIHAAIKRNKRQIDETLRFMVEEGLLETIDIATEPGRGRPEIAYKRVSNE